VADVPHNLPETPNTDLTVPEIKDALAATSFSKQREAVEKFTLAALSAIPWVGGFLSAAASLKLEERASRKDDLQTKWLEVHDGKMQELGGTLQSTVSRFDALGDEVYERVQSDEYLGIVRKSFRAWDEAATEEKRKSVANLVTNAAGTRVVSDDVVRLFIDWLGLYHEAHFAVIQKIYKNPGITRHDMWTELWGDSPRDDSAEADLFKMLIRDLSTGGVIRIARDTDHYGRFVRKRPAPTRKGHAPTTIETPFEDTKPYVLTEMGKQFVHYTMTETVGQLKGSVNETGEPPPSAG
jgi:hypothetical protein